MEVLQIGDQQVALVAISLIIVESLKCPKNFLTLLNSWSAESIGSCAAAASGVMTTTRQKLNTESSSAFRAPWITAV